MEMERTEVKEAVEEERRVVPRSGFAQSKAHALVIRMFDLRRGGGVGYVALYALCRIVRAIFHTG
ncbi:MAG: hypothetical protein IRY88_06215 [Rubrobacteraceae bacterium]|nr:hypothetical protein [Rubrobacteraceae bacterium]